MRITAPPSIAVISAAALAAAAGWLVLDNAAETQVDLPAPANVRVVNGDTPGKVTVSWDAVGGASGHIIQWLDGDASRDAPYADQSWLRI